MRVGRPKGLWRLTLVVTVNEHRKAGVCDHSSGSEWNTVIYELCHSTKHLSLRLVVALEECTVWCVQVTCFNDGPTFAHLLSAFPCTLCVKSRDE